MSICRRQQTGGIYIFHGMDDAYHCQICNILKGEDWRGTSRWAVLVHLMEHRLTEGASVNIVPALWGVWYRT